MKWQHFAKRPIFAWEHFCSYFSERKKRVDIRAAAAPSSTYSTYSSLVLVKYGYNSACMCVHVRTYARVCVFPPDSFSPFSPYGIGESPGEKVGFGCRVQRFPPCTVYFGQLM